jgi:hypothetical protein
MAAPLPITGLPASATFTDLDLIATVPYATGATSKTTVKQFKDSFIPYVKIASKSGINSAVVATTILDYEYGVTLATSIPMVVIYERVTGTNTGIFAKLTDSGSDLTTASDMSALAATSKRYLQLVNTGVAIVASGNLSVSVTVGSSLPATFKATVYGLRTP